MANTRWYCLMSCSEPPADRGFDSQGAPKPAREATSGAPRLVVSVLALVFVLGGTATAERRVFNIADYGAKGDGKTINTTSIHQTIQACAQAGGGTVYVPTGEFRTGTVVLASNVHLLIEAGGVLKGSDRISDYLAEGNNRFGLILARSAENIAITGHGTLDGNGTAFMDLNKKRVDVDFDGKFIRQGKDYIYGDKEMGDGPVLPLDRPGNMFVFSECKNLLIRDVTIKDSPNWTIHVADSDGADILGVRILNGISYANNDGIHCTTSRNIHISDCHISAGDDGICVTGFGPKKGVSENVTVSNCTIQSRSSGIRVGYGDNSIRNCLFQNLVIYGSNRGLGIFSRDRGDIENIQFSNITIETRLHTGHWWGHGEPIHVSAVPIYENVISGEIRNIRFTDITARSESGIVLHGLKEKPMKNLIFKDVHLTFLPSPLSAPYGGNFDLRPTLDKAWAIFKHDIPALFGRYVNGLSIQGFDLEWSGPAADYLTHGIEVEHFEDLVIDNFKGKQAASKPGTAAIALNHGKNVTIRNCQARPGTEVFLAHSDLSGQGLFVNNDLSAAKKAVQPEKAPLASYGNITPRK
jgi:glycosyl hydrolase family 28/pectate lyase-like protein